VTAGVVELQAPERAAALAHLRHLAGSGPLTLLTATRDVEHSQAAVLAARLRDARRLTGQERPGRIACV
jgi:uncharacterized protein YeaO (DUF488 family)